MPQRIEAWSIPGADAQPIFGQTHRPEDEPRGVIVIAHGFKGYKDYGMFPRLAAACASGGLIAHRFNFSHSGMTNDLDTFERPDLFERDTWNRQVFDLERVIDSTSAPLPYFLFGHSRGGVTAILTAGRRADDATVAQPAGVITAAAPATANSLSEDDQRRLLRDGFLDSPSSRTGQVLRIGRAFLQEQLDDPASHDVPAMAGRLRCPMLIIHGRDDPTVPVAAAHELARAAASRARTHVIPGGDHVFNTTNPTPMFPPPPSSPQLQSLLSAVLDFTRSLDAD